MDRLIDYSPRLIPVLKVRDFKKSMDFYTSLAGFTTLYDRPEEEFAMLDKEGAHIMIESLSPLSKNWEVGKLEAPFGRGINFQIQVADVQTLYNSFQEQKYRIFHPLSETWYRKDETEVGNNQFLVQDPDGYLLRFFQDLGTRGVGGAN